VGSLDRSIDYERIHRMRGEGQGWEQISQAFMATPERLRSGYRRWRRRVAPPVAADTQPDPPVDAEVVLSQDVPATTFRRMQSVEDVVAAFDLDPRIWEAVVVKVGGSSWDQSVKDGTVASSIRIDATFRRIRFHSDDAREVWESYLEDARRHSPRYDRPAVVMPGEGDPVMCEIAIHDPHFGMMAHAAEAGRNQDLKTIRSEYREAVEHLVGVSRIYPVERYLYVVGHDLSHVNQAGSDGKGGATKRGTGQDVDSRQYKIFTTVRRAVVEGIEVAASVAPVDAVLGPGNHDPDENYRLGEVLAAWYRQAPHVDVRYCPKRRKFYNYGSNTFMLTHGEEYRRQRDNLPLIMADECPADWWAVGKLGVREIHTGHNHIRLQGGYYPTAEVSETRGIVTRSLPGLTATDAWHYEEGYSHRRAATLLAYKKSGGLVGLHEFSL